MMPPDAELVKAAKAGSAVAFERLVERYYETVYVVAYTRLRHRETSEDLTQEVFLRMYLFLNKLRDPARFAAWICQVARNLARDWQRRGQRASRLLVRVPLEEDIEKIPDKKQRSVREEIASREEAQAVRGAILDLPAHLSEVVLLRYGQELTADEIGRRLGMHPGSVRRQLRRARLAVKASVEPLLRESAQTLRPPRSSIARATSIIAAAAAMSAKGKSALAQASGGAAWASSISLADSGGVVASVGLFGLLKALWANLLALPAMLAGGLKALLTLKGALIATATTAAVVGGARIQRSPEPEQPAAIQPASPDLFRVRVLDRQGEPVVDARVQLSERVPGASNHHRRRRWVGGRSDTRGEALLAPSRSGKADLKVYKGGFKSGEFEIRSGATEFEAVLARISEVGTRIRGYVVDERDRPIVDARVRLYLSVSSPSDTVRRLDRQEARTDADGRVEFFYRPKGKGEGGSGTLVLDEKGYGLAFASGSLWGDFEKRLLAWRSVMPLRGRVLDEEGNALPGAKVEVNQWAGRDGRGCPLRRVAEVSELSLLTEADENGDFEFSRFSGRDVVEVSIRAPLRQEEIISWRPPMGWARMFSVVNLKPENPIERLPGGVVRLQPGGDITGKVVVKGTDKPPVGYTCIHPILVPHDMRSCRRAISSVPVQEDGTFYVQGLPPFSEMCQRGPAARGGMNGEPVSAGDLRWWVQFRPMMPICEQYVWPNPVTLTLEPGQTRNVLVEVEEGTLVSGSFLDKRTGRPPEFLMTCRATQAGTPFVYFGKHRRYDGRWEIYLPPDTFEIAFNPGIASSWQGEGSHDRTVTVEKGKPIECGVHWTQLDKIIDLK